MGQGQGGTQEKVKDQQWEEGVRGEEHSSQGEDQRWEEVVEVEECFSQCVPVVDTLTLGLESISIGGGQTSNEGIGKPCNGYRSV